MEIKINKEIREYYEKFWMGMTLRNIVWGGMGIVIDLFVGFSLRGKINVEALSWIISLIFIPFFLLGFKKIDGMYIEKYIKAWFKTRFLVPKKLILRDDNIYKAIIEEGDRHSGKAKRKSR